MSLGLPSVDSRPRIPIHLCYGKAMSDAIMLLMNEHRVIDRVLDCLDRYAAAIRAGDSVERGDLAKFVRFVREFADTKHHSKEEKILFPALQENGFPRDSGPVAVMLYEHDVGRELVAQLHSAASALSNEELWNNPAPIIQAASRFTQLLRQHIQKEDNILYPMAQSRLPQAAYDSVCKQCDELEQQHAASGLRQELEKLAAELCERYPEPS